MDISFTVCVRFCLFVCLYGYGFLRREQSYIAASNFARWLIGIVGKESPILENFAPPEAQNRTNRPARSCCNEYLYSPNKYGRRVNNTNTIQTTQLQIRQKHLKLDSNLDTRLAHNTLGRAKPKYS